MATNTIIPIATGTLNLWARSGLRAGYEYFGSRPRGIIGLTWGEK